MLKKKITIGLLTVFASFLFLGLVNTPVAHAASADDCHSNADICFIPNVTIPGLTSLPGIEKCSETRQVLNKDGKIVPDNKDGFKVNNCSIAQYVKGLYNYVAGIAGIVAMFMIVFAAWQWIMAAGNAGKIDTAKDTIRGALIGLALIFGGYLLMNSISERLVSFDSLQIAPIIPNTFSGVCSDLDAEECAERYDCNWHNAPTPDGGACVDNFMCALPDWETVNEVYLAARAQLICCGKNNWFVASNWVIGMKGGLFQGCVSLCNNNPQRALEFELDSCLEIHCEEIGNETACENTPYCHWDEVFLDECKFNEHF